MKLRLGLVFLALSLSVFADEKLASQVHEIFSERCASCHNPDVNEGGPNSILSNEDLAPYLNLKNPAKSPLYLAVKSGRMPKDEDPLTAQEIDTILRWIKAGATGFNGAGKVTDKLITNEQIETLVEANLKKAAVSTRPHLRYLTFHHLQNAEGPKAVEVARDALNKLLNSLSWKEKLKAMTVVSKDAGLYRLDLRAYGWTAKSWDSVRFQSPYPITDAKVGELIMRGDFLLMRASRPPFYSELLELPATELELDELLEVDTKKNIETQKAIRAGFNQSGVSRNNRVIERHPTSYGAYWKSYDFIESDGVKNIFNFPLGPKQIFEKNSFEHDGGEMIFNLPNGLQGYYLANKDGEALDRAPVEIVRDPNRPDSTVTNGLSCMQCHSQGIIPKFDEIRSSVSQKTHGKEVFTAVNKLYTPALEAKITEDRARFQTAIEELLGQLPTEEPILVTVRRFERDLTLAQAEAELGLEAGTLAKKSPEFPAELQRKLSVVLKGGAIKRQQFESIYLRIQDNL